MEQIKQEIINNIYENGENLITGPVLQEVLLDMVDDVNSKVASASVAPEIVNKTGSWDDAADWVEENSSSLVHETDLDGYATEQWVESQGYLREVPEGYATTESLNDLSESVAETIENIPSVDLSGYATTQSVNEATESVKDWVEDKHYLTTASLSGSVTEEVVDFKINDATSSVKTWVENQNYATETFVSEAIAAIPGTDLTGYATEAWVEEQGYLKEHQDISGLATTESVTSLSESVANDFANLDIPDVSGLATTSSVNQLSESIAQTIEDLPQPDLSGYLQTSSYLVDSASFDQRINNITGSEADLSGYATTASLNQVSESISSSLDLKADKSDIPSLEGYATEQWVQEQGYLTEHQDISGLATTSSVSALSSSVSSDIQNARTEASAGFAELGGYIIDLGSNLDDLGTRVTNLSESFDRRINNITGSEVDLSGYATTESVNNLSSSVADDFANLNIPDVSGLATTESVNQLSSSIATDILNARTEASAGFASVDQGVVQLSASFDQRINNITGSGGSGVDTDLRNFLFGVESQTLTSITGSSTNILSTISGDTTLGFSAVPDNGTSLGITILNQGSSEAIVTLPDSVTVDSTAYNLINNGVDSSGSMSIPAGEYGDIVVTRQGTDLFVRTSINLEDVDIDLSGYATTASLNSVSQSLSASIATGGVTYQDLNDLGLVHNNEGYWVAADDQVHGGLPEYGEGDFWTNAPAFWRNLVTRGLMGYNQHYSEETGDPQSWDVYLDGTSLASTDWLDNPIGSFLSGLSGAKLATVDFDEWGTYRWVSPIVEEVDGKLNTSSFNTVSASFDQRISNISGSDVDLSGYATTASLNSVSQSISQSIDTLAGNLNDKAEARDLTSLSESVAEDFANLDIPDISGYATTESVNQLSASVSSDIQSARTEVSAGFASVVEYTEGLVDNLGANVTNLSASFDQRINDLPGGEEIWVRGEGSGSVVLSGSGCTATGRFAVAEGYQTTASADYSHAEGFRTAASGNYSHAEGAYTLTSKVSSHAEGYEATASGEGSHAEGCVTVALGNYSHAEGYYTTASNAYEHAQGRFNAVASSQIFSLGVGDAAGGRKNAISIITGSGTVSSASIYIYGIGGYDGTNPQPGTNDLAAVISNLSSSLDLSGYATTQSLNVLDSRVTDLSSSFDTRISQIVAASGGLDPADFAGAPTIVYQTDGTTGLVGVNYYTGSEGQMQSPAFDDTAWQLENLDLSNFDRVECYFKNSSINPATVVTVILDSAAAGPGADTYRGTSWCPRVMAGGRQMYEVVVAVDTSKTKLQVPYQFRVDTNNGTYVDASSDGNYLYKIVGYPKIV